MAEYEYDTFPRSDTPVASLVTWIVVSWLLLIGAAVGFFLGWVVFA